MLSRRRRKRVARVVTTLVSSEIGPLGWPLAAIARESGLSPTATTMTLQELTDAGWVRSTWTVSDECPDGSNGPARRHYVLTTAGRARATNALTARRHHTTTAVRVARAATRPVT